MSQCEIYSSDSCDNRSTNCDPFFSTNSPPPRKPPIPRSKGYDHSDWYISVPVLDPTESFELTDDFIGQTFDYFLISSERLSQMTKTYNDIDAVTRLLEEVSKCPSGQFFDCKLFDFQRFSLTLTLARTIQTT